MPSAQSESACLDANAGPTCRELLFASRRGAEITTHNPNLINERADERMGIGGISNVSHHGGQLDASDIPQLAYESLHVSHRAQARSNVQPRSRSRRRVYEFLVTRRIPRLAKSDEIKIEQRQKMPSAADVEFDHSNVWAGTIQRICVGLCMRVLLPSIAGSKCALKQGSRPVASQVDNLSACRDVSQRASSRAGTPLVGLDHAASVLQLFAL